MLNKKLRILSVQYTLKYRSLDIYVSGCYGNPHCENCHNPESWSFENGELYTTSYFLDNIQKKVKVFPSLIDKIMIYGGEPLDNDIGELLFELSTLNLPIWLFTHYELNIVPQYIKNYCSYIKTGRYLPNLKTDSNVHYGIKLATSNQTIYKKGVHY